MYIIVIIGNLKKHGFSAQKIVSFFQNKKKWHRRIHNDETW